MYIELSGQRYALDGLLTHDGVGLLFTDTPIDEVDRLACALPDTLRVYDARTGEILWEFAGYTRAVELRKNPARPQVFLQLQKENDETERRYSDGHVSR